MNDEEAHEEECKKLVKQLAEWSRKYPMNGIYPLSMQNQVDGELTKMEIQAKKLFPQ